MRQAADARRRAATSDVPWMVGVAAVYFAGARLGLALGALPGNVTPVWPPTGIALAAVLLRGRRMLPGVFVGAFVVNAISAVPLTAATGMAVGNTLEALVGAYLVTEVVRVHPAIDGIRDVVAFAFAAGVLATTVSATIGVSSLLVTGTIHASAAVTTWRVWWTGDALGSIIVTPAVMAWARGRREPEHPPRLEGVAIVAGLVVLTIAIFRTSLVSPYALFLLMVWAALRFSQRGATTMALAVSGVAVWATADGRGPFSLDSSTVGLVRLDLFLVVLAITGTILAAIVRDRKAAHRALREANAALEARVEERTAELARDRTALAEAQEVARLGSWEWDIERNSVEWSDELCSLMGVHRSTEPRTYEDYLAHVHPDDRTLVDAGIRECMASHEPYLFEHRVVLDDGRVRWLQCRGRPQFDALGHLQRIHGTAQDVTERRRAENKFERLLESAPDGMVVIDDAGLIRLVNRQTEALFGYERAELVGEPLEILIPTRFREGHPALRHQYFGGPKTRPMGAGLDLAARRRDGTEFPVDISLSPLETDEGVFVSAAIRDITDRKRAEAAIAHQATHDGLTGLPNRTLLNDRLANALERARRGGDSVAVLFLDVDRLKVINDSLGHSAGDALLRSIAKRLVESVRATETVARFGGDEFVVVAELKPGVRPEAIGERLAAVIAEPTSLGVTEVRPTVSIGIAIAGPTDAAESLLRDADAAMYQAKQGRNQWVIFDTAMRAVADERLRTEQALRIGIEERRLVPFFQPIVEIVTGEIAGMEALVRWRDPDRGLIMPADFIPIAEETGLIVTIGDCVLREACMQVATWNRTRTLPLTVSVNISARQLLAGNLPHVVDTALADSQLDPSLLCLEITESVLLEDADACARALGALKTRGIRLGVDDFGTGYSSLTYLKRFPVDTLKIDRSFMGDLGDKRGDGAIVASLIDLAHAFSLTTVAEGVETAEQLAYLRALGCELGQGHHWSEALPAVDAQAWMELRATTAGTLGPDALSAGGPSRILIVDDDQHVRSAIRALLSTAPNLIVVGEAADGRTAVALARHHRPDVVLLDLAMPGVGGLEALPLILAAAPATRVIVLSALDAPDVLEAALRLGAEAWVAKAEQLESLIDLVARPAPSVA